jgi:HK97 family phage major capsid protein
MNNRIFLTVALVAACALLAMPVAVMAATLPAIAADAQSHQHWIAHLSGASLLFGPMFGITLADRIKTAQTRRDEIAARMKELMDGADEATGRIKDTVQVKEYDTLSTELDELDGDLRRWKSMEIAQNNAVAVEGSKSSDGSHSRGITIINTTKDADDKFKGQSFTRMVIAKALASLEVGIKPSEIAAARWGKSAPVLVQLIKANEVAGGGATSGSWGAELVQANTRFTGDFIEYLKAMTVYDRLPLREIPANVQVKGQDGTATGYWVGEGKAIPASTGDFSAVSLTPLKVAALAVVSNELLRDSSPAAEMLVRDALAYASGQRIDITFLSATAASSGVSPAGMLNGVSAITSAGDNSDGLRTDIKSLYAPFITAKNATGLQFVMNPALAKSVQLMRSTLGLVEFPGVTQNGGTLEGDPLVTGDNVGSGHLILLKPSDIYRIGDSGVEVSISRDASIEMSTAPTGAELTPTAASQAIVSMFQSESTAIKVVRSINFAKRRTGVVQYVSGAEYSDSGSPQ